MQVPAHHPEAGGGQASGRDAGEQRPSKASPTTAQRWRRWATHGPKPGALVPGAAAALALALTGVPHGVWGVRMAPEAFQGGRTVKPFRLPLPDGSQREIRYTAGGGGGHSKELQDGVFAFTLFPGNEAAVLTDVIEAWDRHVADGPGRRIDREGHEVALWSRTSDTVDSLPEVQIQAWQDEWFDGKVDFSSTPTDALYRKLRSTPLTKSGTAKDTAFLIPLLKTIWADTLKPHLTTVYGVREDEDGRLETPLTDVFIRKYEGGSIRTKFAGHQDRSVFTFNIALSDQRDIDGGELFVCKQVPPSYAMLFPSAGSATNVRDKAASFVGGRFEAPQLGEQASEQASQEQLGAASTVPWFDMHHNPSRLRGQEDDQGLCKAAQPDMGEALFHHGKRYHGVMPTREGTRYSMIFFIGRCDETRGCMEHHGAPGEAALASKEAYTERQYFYGEYTEPVTAKTVANMPRDEVVVWLKGYAALLKAAKKAPALRERMFRTVVASEGVYALEKWADDPELARFAVHVCFSLVAKGGPFDALIELWTGKAVQGTDHWKERLKAVPSALDVFRKAAAKIAEKGDGGKGNLTSARTLAEVCVLVGALGGGSPHCQRQRVKRWQSATKLSADQLHELHVRCTSNWEARWRAGKPLDPDCYQVLEQVRDEF